MIEEVLFQNFNMHIFNELNLLNRINGLPDLGMMCTSCYINLKKNYVFHCVFIVIQVLYVLLETFLCIVAH